jgi:hypothetical protein
MVSSLVFTKSATTRLLGCRADQIQTLEVWSNCIFVHVRGQRPKFVSKTRFYSEFSDFRRQGAKGCKVEKFGAGCYLGTYHVISPGADKRYHNIRLGYAWDACDCEDYAQQKAQNFPQPCCKHLWAVCGHLGVNTLEEAIALQRAQRDALDAAEWREAAPVIKPPVMVSPRPLPVQFAHVSIA